MNIKTGEIIRLPVTKSYRPRHQPPDAPVTPDRKFVSLTDDEEYMLRRLSNEERISWFNELSMEERIRRISAAEQVESEASNGDTEDDH